MKAGIFDVMTELARKKARITTLELARRLGSSQQTVSRKIRELESLGFIERQTTSKGQLIAFTEEGMKFLRKRYLDLKDIMERSKMEAISFGGALVSGSGEGHYYVSQEEYFLQFHEKLGFRPFLGTLNVRLRNIHDIKTKDEMERMKPIIVKGFKKENRAFGDIRCYHCVINRRVKGAIVIPERSHHPVDVVEIIAPVFLRKNLSLKDNDYVHVEVRP